MGFIRYYQITCQPVNQAICSFITVPIVFCNLVSIKCIVLYYFYYCVVLCCTYTPKTSGPCIQWWLFLTPQVWNVSVWHCTSSNCGSLCMLYKFRCNLCYPSGVCAGANYTNTLGRTLVYLSAPRCRTYQYCQKFIPLCVFVVWSCWPCIWWCGTDEFYEQGQFFFIGFSCSLFFYFLRLSIYHIFLSTGWYCDDWVFAQIGCKLFSPCLALLTIFLK